jgi:mRNA degradation ribonuclease J1/J2
MYALAKPKIAIPVHGEFLHTKTHCEIALECGVAKAIQTENGLAVKIDDENPEASETVGFVKNGYFAVDGRQLLDFKGDVIRERRKLQEAGIVTLSVAVDESLNILASPRIICVGSYDLKSDREAENMIRKELQIFFKNKAREYSLEKGGFSLKFLKNKKKKKSKGIRSTVELEKSLRSKLLQIFDDLMGKRPAVEIMIHLVN